MPVLHDELSVLERMRLHGLTVATVGGAAGTERRSESGGELGRALGGVTALHEWTCVASIVAEHAVFGGAAGAGGGAGGNGADAPYETAGRVIDFAQAQHRLRAMRASR